MAYHGYDDFTIDMMANSWINGKILFFILRYERTNFIKYNCHKREIYGSKLTNKLLFVCKKVLKQSKKEFFAKVKTAIYPGNDGLP